MTSNRINTRILLFIFACWMCVDSFASQREGKPMDTKAAEKISQIRPVLARVREKGKMVDDDRKLLSGIIDSGDPVLISLAAYIVGESEGEDTVLCEKLAAFLEKENAVAELPQAFIQLALRERELRGKPQRVRIEGLKELVKQQNPYLKIEAAKRILSLDRSQGRSVLTDIKSTGDVRLKREVDRLLLKTKESKQSTTPLSDEQYALVLSVIATE
jgi:hypothetical protein